MEEGPVTGPGERQTSMSTSHEVQIRHSAPPQSSRTLEGSHPLSFGSNVQDVQRSASAEVWAGAISRLQTQVSLNTSLLESHRQKVHDIENAINNLNFEMANVKSALHNIQAELRTRSAPEPVRHQSEDLEVLVEQVQAVTNKVNEVDALRMQIELLKNRLKRWEEQGSPVGVGPRSGPASAHRESSLHEVPPPPPVGVPHPPLKPAQYQPLPPMRTSATTSPLQNRPMHRAVPTPVLESQASTRAHPPFDARQHSSDSSATFQGSSAGSFRPTEPLPPPSAISGWRPAELHTPVSSVPQPPPPPAPVRPHAMEPEPSSTGWTTVNASQAPKRPLEEPRQASYEQLMTGSPKRPKLAPIMPRSAYVDEASYVPSSITQSATAEAAFRTHSRVPSDASQSQSQALPTPASANTPAHRFIISTQSADSQECWRPEAERLMHMHPLGQGQGRRGGRGNRNRARSGRGGRSSGMHPPDVPELSTPEWDKPDWTGSQISPNGFYNPLPPQHHSPVESARGGPSGQSGDMQTEVAATPLAVQGPYDPFQADTSGLSTSGGKKSRTKPVRNAEGVLIRKDGRPDMRSVSSANNLRKVHAKKEAERAEMEGRTPTSARSLVPATSPSDEGNATYSGSPGTPGDEADGDGEEGEGQQDVQERQSELISRIFPSGADGSSGRSAAERFFPRQDQDVPETAMKSEPANEEQSQTIAVEKDGGSQMTDVVMKEMSDAQAEDHAQQEEPQQDTHMPTVHEEGGKEQNPT